MTQLDVRDACLKIDDRLVLRGVSIHIERGEMVALVGPSGCGKTTALNIASLLASPSSGEVIVDGESAGSWREERRRRFWRDKASFVFQDLSLMLEESVAANVEIGVKAARRKRDQVKEAATEALSTVGLVDRAAEPASHLSGGERQRVAIARAIAKGASCIFADEPTASLDVVNAGLVGRLLRDRAELGCAVLIATHDLNLARRCDRMVEL